MSDDPRVLVLQEMRKQTNLLTRIAVTVEMIAGMREEERKPAAVNIDGPHGDPVVKAKDPKDWTGEPMKGKRFSECPPDYLEMVASRLDFFASKNTDMEKQKWELLDARRARAWAARLRNGWKAPVSERVDETQTEPTW